MGQSNTTVEAPDFSPAVCPSLPPKRDMARVAMPQTGLTR